MRPQSSPASMTKPRSGLIDAGLDGIDEQAA